MSTCFSDQFHIFGLGDKNTTQSAFSDLCNCRKAIRIRPIHKNWLKKTQRGEKPYFLQRS